jgi:hypothetical protein
MASKVADSYTVLLREKKLPLQLLEDPDAARRVGAKQARVDLLTTQPFAATFGPSTSRKRPKLAAEGYEGLVAAAAAREQRYEAAAEAGAPQGEFEEFKDAVRWSACCCRVACGVRGLLARIEGTRAPRAGRGTAQEGCCLWQRVLRAHTHTHTHTHGRDMLTRVARAPSPAPPPTTTSQAKEAIFEKGQSKRIWGELYKVLDSSDVVIQVRRTEGRAACVRACVCVCVCVCVVIARACRARIFRLGGGGAPPRRALHRTMKRCAPTPNPPHSPQVLDARDPEGTRCKFIEQHIRKNARHKHLLLLLNKCDLVSVGAPWRRLWCCCWRALAGWPVRPPAGSEREAVMITRLSVPSEASAADEQNRGISLA